jgi:hypothetical protein
VTLLGALVQRVQSNQKPTPATVAQACPAVAAEYPAGVGCKFDPAYVPAPLESRMPALQRPLLNFSNLSGLSRAGAGLPIAAFRYGR